ncbi:hypothetical protein PVAP13_1NG389700 [Panicum virgatum]|uniref:Uncharacterized protein n=1 Tax=Panicum virgatum TaxID=38727 RepID=A0A8T0X4R0_PANVG|nr:hypothetical protein PVAP13_1NG389700 [Panicum virgatum]
MSSSLQHCLISLSLVLLGPSVPIQDGPGCSRPQLRCPSISIHPLAAPPSCMPTTLRRRCYPSASSSLRAAAPQSAPCRSPGRPESLELPRRVARLGARVTGAARPWA